MQYVRAYIYVKLRKIRKFLRIINRFLRIINFLLSPKHTSIGFTSKKSYYFLDAFPAVHQKINPERDDITVK